MCRNHSFIACLCHIYMGVALHAHPVHGELHIQRNANGEVATTSPPFYSEPHQSHVLLRRSHLARLLHPGHSTIWLRLESPSSKCTKLHTMAASNNRDHAITLLLLVRARLVLLFFTHLLFMVNHTFNATPTERLQQHQLSPMNHNACT